MDDFRKEAHLQGKRLIFNVQYIAERLTQYDSGIKEMGEVGDQIDTWEKLVKRADELGVPNPVFCFGVDYNNEFDNKGHDEFDFDNSRFVSMEVVDEETWEEDIQRYHAYFRSNRSQVFVVDGSRYAIVTAESDDENFAS